MGANMRYLDVGGGLAIDYDGSFTDTHASMSYTIQNCAPRPPLPCHSTRVWSASGCCMSVPLHLIICAD